MTGERGDKRLRGKGRIWRKVLVRSLLVCLCLVVGVIAALKIWQWFLPDDAPVVGVSLDTAWHARVGITSKSYEIALTRAGGRIRWLWPGSEDPEEILDEIDALLLAGGGDIDPEVYGGESATGELVDRERDEFELALIRGAIERDMPILGICRGIQILNVSQGGSVRNLRDRPELVEVHGIHLDSMEAHEVNITADSKIAGILGAGEREVSSFHGQAIDRLGEDLRVVATAPDGVVEAVELPGQSFVIGIQWHPELSPEQIGVFEALISEAKGYRQWQ